VANINIAVVSRVPWLKRLAVAGTPKKRPILDVAETPESVVVPASMVRTLGELRARIGGALALVSGRLIANLDDLSSRSNCLVSVDMVQKCAFSGGAPEQGRKGP
jgi:hypothetical protein